MLHLRNSVDHDPHQIPENLKSIRGVTNPEDVLLIQIRKSTYQTDRDNKLSMYAEHSIKEVWIDNLLNNTLEVYHNPRQISSGWVYDIPKVFQVGEWVTPLAFPDDAFQWSTL